MKLQCTVYKEQGMSNIQGSGFLPHLRRGDGHFYLYSYRPFAPTGQSQFLTAHRLYLMAYAYHLHEAWTFQLDITWVLHLEHWLFLVPCNLDIEH